MSSSKAIAFAQSWCLAFSVVLGVLLGLFFLMWGWSILIERLVQMLGGLGLFIGLTMPFPVGLATMYVCLKDEPDGQP